MVVAEAEAKAVVARVEARAPLPELPKMMAEPVALVVLAALVVLVELVAQAELVAQVEGGTSRQVWSR